MLNASGLRAFREQGCLFGVGADLLQRVQTAVAVRVGMKAASLLPA
jgi:hypothetical protein